MAAVQLVVLTPDTRAEPGVVLYSAVAAVGLEPVVPAMPVAAAEVGEFILLAAAELRGLVLPEERVHRARKGPVMAAAAARTTTTQEARAEHHRAAAGVRVPRTLPRASVGLEAGASAAYGLGEKNPQIVGIWDCISDTGILIAAFFTLVSAL